MKEWNHRRFIVSCFLTAMILFAGLTAGCKGNTEKEAVKRPEVSGVTATPVSLSTVDEVYEATGTVRSDRTSTVAGRVMGVVTSLLVREGDTVKAGQVLLIIDDRDAATTGPCRQHGCGVGKAEQIFGGKHLAAI